MSHRILVVEDETPNVEILQRLLTHHSFDVIVAWTKREACELARDENVDLILMDIGIPNDRGEPRNETGGLEATVIIKANEATCHIPVIATTARAMLDERQAFRDAGCDDVQEKPYDFTELINAINKQLEAAKK
jgi:two-component system, cell cycle response regulator DivK